MEMKRPVKIKVCGLRDPGNIEAVSALSPDFAGYIFFPGSPRYVGEKPDPSIFRIPGDGTARVGVFVDGELSEVRRIFETCWLDLVQLHGRESPEYCRQLTDAGIPVIKTLFPSEMGGGDNMQEGWSILKRYTEVGHYLLFDSGTGGSGGTGHPFDWELLREISPPVPFLVGGGVGPGDAGKVKRMGHPSFFGVDVNSRFETSPGMKDPRLLARFINQIRH